MVVVVVVDYGDAIVVFVIVCNDGAMICVTYGNAVVTANVVNDCA